MDAKQIHDLIVLKSLKEIGPNFNKPNARFLMMLTCAIESDMGHYIEQKKSRVAKGIFQMEPETALSLFDYSRALKNNSILISVASFMIPNKPIAFQLMYSPLFACVMARILYSTFKEPIPELTGNLEQDVYNMWPIYKTQYNTHKGASTLERFLIRAAKHNINYKMIDYE